MARSLRKLTLLEQSLLGICFVLTGFCEKGLDAALATVAHVPGSGIPEPSEYNREKIMKNFWPQSWLS